MTRLAKISKTMKWLLKQNDGKTTKKTINCHSAILFFHSIYVWFFFIFFCLNSRQLQLFLTLFFFLLQQGKTKQTFPNFKERNGGLLNLPPHLFPFLSTRSRSIVGRYFHTWCLSVRKTKHATELKQNHLATLHGTWWITKFARLVFVFG